MNKRIQKILSRKDHPRFASEKAAGERRIMLYAKNECRRRGLNPDNWGSYTLRWPASLMKPWNMALATLRRPNL